MKNSRRNFLKLATVLPLGAAFSRNFKLEEAQAENATYVFGALKGKAAHKLPALPYSYDALEPYIDAKTMTIHHDKHHAGYVKGLNKAERMLRIARENNDFSDIQHWTKKASFCAGGHFLHSMFWKVMAPKGKGGGGGGGGEPKGKLLRAIEKDFGNFNAFKKHFNAAAASVEGSGWGVLSYRPADKKLIIHQIENQHKLAPAGTIPVLGIDVWEHAYYLR